MSERFRAFGRLYRRGAGRLLGFELFVGEEKLALHVSLNVLGEQAEEYVGAHHVAFAMEDGPYL